MRIGCAAITARLLLLGTYAKEELHGIEALNAKESVNELGSYDRVGRVVQRAVMKHLHEATLSLSETRARGFVHAHEHAPAQRTFASIGDLVCSWSIE